MVVPLSRLIHIVREDDRNNYFRAVSTPTGGFLSVEAESLAICLVIVVVVCQSPCVSHIEAVAKVLGKE